MRLFSGLALPEARLRSGDGRRARSRMRRFGGRGNKRLGIFPGLSACLLGSRTLARMGSHA
eukprot:3311612-Pleurochrysis_carterae.AAC.1